jgi:protein Mpv17
MLLATLFFILVVCFGTVSPFSLAIPNIVESYSNCLESQPLLTNVITASTLCVTSDFISQTFERSKAKECIIQAATEINSLTEYQQISMKNTILPKLPDYSFYRSFCMSVYGASVYGWLINYWFSYMNYLIPQEGITSPLILEKVLLNQVCCSPLLNIFFFIFVTMTRDIMKTTFPGKILQVKRKLEIDFIPTYQRSCLFWPLVQFINFSYIGTEYQLLYTNSAFVLWTTYISFIGFRKMECKVE